MVVLGLSCRLQLTPSRLTVTSVHSRSNAETPKQRRLQWCTPLRPRVHNRDKSPQIKVYKCTTSPLHLCVRRARRLTSTVVSSASRCCLTDETAGCNATHVSSLLTRSSVRYLIHLWPYPTTLLQPYGTNQVVCLRSARCRFLMKDLIRP